MHRKFHFTEVFSGGAFGADHEGELWAASKNISVKVFQADWDILGRRAGMVRNDRMLQAANRNGNCVVIAFPGGKGTNHMIDIACDEGVPVWYPRSEQPLEESLPF